MKRVLCLALVCVAALVVPSGQAQGAIITHNSDFIADGSRTNFNGFEFIPNDGTFFTGGGGPYTEDTIQVQQINGDAGNDIWVKFNFGSGFQGARGWYPNGGDNGYTELTLTGGLDFQSVGFNYGTGNATSQNTILYELLDNGGVVLSGSAILDPSVVNYLGFSGGGFDTIRLRDASSGDSGTVTDGTFQLLTIDSIELLNTSVIPEPTTFAIWSVLSLIGVGVGARRKRRKA